MLSQQPGVGVVSSHFRDEEAGLREGRWLAPGDTGSQRWARTRCPGRKVTIPHGKTEAREMRNLPKVTIRHHATLPPRNTVA